jgi:Zn-finger nucleic acid-binding protein
VRLIVACPHCHRQFDASGYEVGSRFHCYCGTLVTVTEPEPHEAAVIRCSACGAPRSKGPTCVHCHSAFALFEQDRTSICPHCMTRVSERARFCHSCGRAIASEGQIGELSEMICPACGGDRHMHSRALGTDLAVLECSACAGLWLGRETFEHVIRRAEEMATMLASRREHGPDLGPTKPTGAAQPVRYRPCPVCKTMMNRNQYGKFSKVIVDTCKQHGTWLDDGELTQILEWVRDGGLERSRIAQHEQRMSELRMQQSTGSANASMSGVGRFEEPSDSLLLRLLRML